MGNPYEDLSVQVALTELRDVSFQTQNDYACGHQFVIGHGKILDSTSKQKAMRRPSTSENMNRKYALPSSGLGVTTDLSEIKSEGMHEEQSSLPCC